jgi:hypothetical protein
VPLDFLIDPTSMGTLVAITVVSIGVMVFRRIAPALPRGFRVPGYRVVPVLSIAFCLYLIAGLRDQLRPVRPVADGRLRDLRAHPLHTADDGPGTRRERHPGPGLTGAVTGTTVVRGGRAGIRVAIHCWIDRPTRPDRQARPPAPTTTPALKHGEWAASTAPGLDDQGDCVSSLASAEKT